MSGTSHIIYSVMFLAFLSGCGSGGSGNGSSDSAPVGVAVPPPEGPGAEQLKCSNQVTYPGTRHDYGRRTKLEVKWSVAPEWLDHYLGRNMALAMKNSERVLKDERSQKYVELLVKKLAEKAPGDIRYVYRAIIIDSKLINASCAPGGLIFVNRGLLQNVESEAQLAGILAHEISHVALRHGTQLIKSHFGPLKIVSFPFGYIANELLTLKYRRDYETEADIGAAQMLYDSGIDPMAFAEFFRNISRSGWQPWMNWSVSHPPSDERYAKVQREIEMSGGLYGTFQCNSDDFRRMQAHLKTLP